MSTFGRNLDSLHTLLKSDLHKVHSVWIVLPLNLRLLLSEIFSLDWTYFMSIVKQ